MAKAKVLNGKDFMIFMGGKATALSTSHKLTLSAETSDAASKLRIYQIHLLRIRFSLYKDVMGGIDRSIG